MQVNSSFYFLAFWYVFASAITFWVYLRDKWAAKSARWRTRESTLHFLALIGGWPGAWLAQRVLRHKSRKSTFRAAFWFTVAIHCAGVAGMSALTLGG